MKKNSTELVFILDKSGSMAGMELNFQAMSETVACFRATGAVPAAPMEAIRKDMKKRGHRR